METDLRRSLIKWSEQALENIGINKNNVTNIEDLRTKVIEDLRATYSEKVLAFSLEPSNSRIIPTPDGYAKLTGPCGDTMEIYLTVERDRILEASFQTDGCIPSIASGNMATALVQGKSLNEAIIINQETILNALGGLPEDSTHCALLAANTLRQAIKDFSNRL